MSNRTIITSYLVRSERGPLALGNEEQANKWLSEAQKRGWRARIQKITTNTKRAQQIGENLFKTKLPTENLISFRNQIVKEMHDYCEKIGAGDESDRSFAWKKISRKYNINCSFEEFHQCVMDKIEYSDV